MVEERELRGILIDARTKSITEVHTGPYPAWKTLIECDDINAVSLEHNDDGHIETLWVDGEGLLNDKANGPFFKMVQYHQPMAVVGIILGTDEQGETVDTRWTVEDVEKFVTWPEVHFTGLKPIPGHMETHPVLGKMFVTGSVAQFEADTNMRADEEDNEKGD